MEVNDTYPLGQCGKCKVKIGVEELFELMHRPKYNYAVR